MQREKAPTRLSTSVMITGQLQQVLAPSRSQITTSRSCCVPRSDRRQASKVSASAKASQAPAEAVASRRDALIAGGHDRFVSNTTNPGERVGWKFHPVVCSWGCCWSTFPCWCISCKCWTANNQNLKPIGFPEGLPTTIPGGTPLLHLAALVRSMLRKKLNEGCAAGKSST